MYLDIIYVSVAQHLNSLKSACIVTKLFMQHVHVIPLCSLSNSFVSIFHWPFADELQYSERQSCLVKIGSTLVPSNCHAVYTGLCFFSPSHRQDLSMEQGSWPCILVAERRVHLVIDGIHCCSRCKCSLSSKDCKRRFTSREGRNICHLDETRPTCSPHSSAHCINRQIKLARQACNMVSDQI